jgi:hypothetical protein
MLGIYLNMQQANKSGDFALFKKNSSPAQSASMRQGECMPSPYRIPVLSL